MSKFIFSWLFFFSVAVLSGQQLLPENVSIQQLLSAAILQDSIICGSVGSLHNKSENVSNSSLLGSWHVVEKLVQKQYKCFEEIGVIYFYYGFHSEDKLIFSVETESRINYYELDEQDGAIHIVERRGFNHIFQAAKDLARLNTSFESDVLLLLTLNQDKEFTILVDNGASPTKYGIIDRMLKEVAICKEE